jgi:hypothetical protein
MMKDLKLGLFSVAISASAGIAPTATLGFAAVAPFIVALWRVLAGTTNTGMHSVHPRTVGGREQE